ncbi:MAG: translational GTPase TypA [Alphaproteobacteria bacterium]|nr:translational GTPase TypA [Rickettsiales bacterium]
MADENGSIADRNGIRNIAIIAHVDHGKTTLIDSFLKQSGAMGRDADSTHDRIMDSNDLEKERGITILAKCTSVIWDDIRINIIDTPGHADFGGEVERVLQMVDSVVLLVDSAEGVMPQTKFVLSKALAIGLKPIVVINKIDRSDQRMKEVLDEAFDLFVSLDASDEQLDFPIVYASGRSGYAILDLNEPKKGDLKPLFDVIVKHAQPPSVLPSDEFAFLGTILEVDEFVGRTLTGKIYSGVAKVGATVKVMNRLGEVIERGKITRLQTFNGVDRVSTEEAMAGDIIRLSGLKIASVSDTICTEAVEEAIPSDSIDPPTIAMTIGVNTSPLAGQNGSKLTSTIIRQRLEREAEVNIAITLSESEQKDAFEIGGRGELQLGVLIETMRREGFELSVSRPRVIFREENGKKTEPLEEVVIDVDDEYSGSVVEKLGLRRGEMSDMKPSVNGKTRMKFIVPSRGLIGYRNEFLTDTRGTGILNRLFHSYGPYRGDIKRYRNGVLTSTESGKAVAYALFNLQERGMMFVKPQDLVYQGMIVGEHNRGNDLQINVVKTKQLTNMRASGSDENVKLQPAKIMTLEDMMSYIAEDEMIEVTRSTIRMRKIHLNPSDRKRTTGK